MQPRHDGTVETPADLVDRAVAALGDRRPAPERALLGTARAAHAEAVAHVAFDPVRCLGTLAYWTDLTAAPRRVVTDETTDGATGPPIWRRSTACDLLTRVWRLPTLTEVPLTHDEPPRVLAVYARHGAFSGTDLEVLRRAHLLPTQPGPDRRRAADLGLTPREVEVLELLSRGLLAASIAARMRVSPRTVHKHLGSVYRKLDTHDRLLAVEQARTLGILG